MSQPGGGRPEFAPPGTAAPPPTTVAPVPALPPVTPPRRAPRSRAVMIAVVSVLAALAVLVAGDRVANAVAQDALGRALQAELSTPTRPEVTIGGFPFVTQALGGSFSSVEVTADDATVADGDTTVAVAHLEATLTGITATDRYRTIVVDRGQATALVDWAALSTLAGQRISHDVDDRMRIDFSVPIGRLSIEGAITGRPELDAAAQTITVTDPQVTVANVDVPQGVVDAVSRLVLRPFPIEDLPYDIQVSGLTVQPDGVLLSGTGEDIPVRGR